MISLKGVDALILTLCAELSEVTDVRKAVDASAGVHPDPGPFIASLPHRKVSPDIENIGGRLSTVSERGSGAFSVCLGVLPLTRIWLTPEFFGDLGEFYFKHLCAQRSFAYIRLEKIQRTLPNPILEFTYRYWRIPVQVSKEAIDEVTRVSRPMIFNESESYVFDFLTTKVRRSDYLDYPNVRQLADLCWVEIKTGNSQLSDHQLQVSRSCKIRFSVFRVRNVHLSPGLVDIEWPFDSIRNQT